MTFSASQRTPMDLALAGLALYSHETSIHLTPLHRVRVGIYIS
jgi:hypothetical protein